MFENLKSTGWRSATLCLVMGAFFGWGEGFVAAATCTAYDAFTDPRVMLALRLIVHVARERMKPVSPEANVARRPMRRPVSRTTDASDGGGESKSATL